MKTTKLTVEEHCKTGRRLHEIYHELLTLSCLIPNTYGKTSKPGKLAQKAAQAVDKMRCELDDQFYRDHPKDADSFESYYFSPNVASEPQRKGGHDAN